MEITCQPRDLGVGFQEDTDIMNGHYQLILFVQLESSVRQQFCSLLSRATLASNESWSVREHHFQM